MEYLVIHPVNPQPRFIKKAVEILKRGGLAAYPTDSCYALGCLLSAKGAQDRIRQLRNLEQEHFFTLICENLSEVGRYCVLRNESFRLLKQCLPGAYTFILPSQDVARNLLDKRKTIGVRVPDHPIVQALLSELDEPLLSSTLWLPQDDTPLADPETIRDRLEHALDLLIDGGIGDTTPTTVVDLSGDTPNILRIGRGDASFFTKSQT
jgi:tRNA threonylcarbamoyl adenosine modification protein (Sua5/YciO/YrdC/YwlC family)